MIPILHLNNQNCAHGSNANGDFLVFADGTQLCWHTIPFAFDSAATLVGDWTFPRAFDAPPLVFAMKGPGANIAGLANNATGPWAEGVHTTTAVRLYIGRIAGQTDYAPGNTWSADVLAIGHASPARNEAADLLHWNDENVMRGNNANGEFIRFPNGLQICWAVRTATRISNTGLSNTWTYPRSFMGAPVIVSTLGAVRNTAPPDNGIVGPRQGFKGAVSGSLLANRIAGQANFDMADMCEVEAVAIGMG